MQVLIISGHRQGQNIANRLLAKEELRVMFRSAEHEVTFIEEDEALCKELERRYLLQTLEETGWKKKRAAEILGINPSTLYRKLQRYGMDTGEEE